MRQADIDLGGTIIRTAIPESFWERLTGLRRRHGPMLFRASSVHGLGMNRTLSVVAIGPDRRVIAVRSLRPGGFVRVKDAAWMLEIESGSPTPTVGTPVHFYSRSDDRTTHRVRHSHRQPGRHLRAPRRNAG